MIYKRCSESPESFLMRKQKRRGEEEEGIQKEQSTKKYVEQKISDTVIRRKTIKE